RYLQVGIFEAHVTITDSNHGVSPTTSVGVFVKRRPLVFVPGIIGSSLSAPTGADIQIPNGHGGMVRTAGYTGEVWPHVVSWDPTSTEDFFDILKLDRKSTRLNSSHVAISYAVFCLKKHNWRVAHRLAREVVAK